MTDRKKTGVASSDPDGSARRCNRAMALAGVLCSWFLISMAGAASNTSWEHNPFGGPFILIKGSRSLIDFVASAIVCVSILAPAAHWVWTGKIWSALLAIAMAGASVLLSIILAAGASV
jgi:hypothetical protein